MFYRAYRAQFNDLRQESMKLETKSPYRPYYTNTFARIESLCTLTFRCLHDAIVKDNENYKVCGNV